MSVIQNIQEKYAKLMAIIIAIALITFVVMLAFENGGNLFRGGNTTAIGKVNGKKIEYADFIKRVDRQEALYGSGAMAQEQAVDGAWNEEIREALQNSEFDKLGISVTKRELGDILYGPNPPEDLKKQFTDPATNLYNAQMAKQQIDQVLRTKKGTAEQLANREQLITYINALESQRRSDKYISLLNNSYNVPKWLIEAENADKSQMARISLVRELYAANTDTSIKVTEKEMQEYIDSHKEDFPQNDETRSIDYVAFSAKPNGADSAAARERLMALKPGLDTTKEINQFLLAQGVQNFYDGYINGSRVQIPVKDSIFRLPVGSVYGPYLDGGSYATAKLLGARTQPDSVTVRHILVATVQQDPQSGQPYTVRDSATAKKLIDSIQTAIRNGSNFDTVCVKLSDDQGSKEKGGLYEKVESGGMVPEFNDFIFGNPTGSKGVVKTEFGYHYVEILSQKGSSPAYKVAYISKPIEVSAETDNTANSDASMFAGDSRDKKSFDANAEKLKAKGILKNSAPDMGKMSYQVPGLGVSRSFVKSVFKADVGDVLDPEKIGDNWVVAIVTEITEEGTLPVSKARMQVEPILRNKKIAEKLKQKIGTVTTLEAASSALGNRPIEPIDSIRMTGQQNMAAGFLQGEPIVLGAAFNPANKGQVVKQVLVGNSGVYVIRVDNVSATPVADASVAEQRKSRYQQGKQQGGGYQALNALREAATITDRRSEFY